MGLFGFLRDLFGGGEDDEDDEDGGALLDPDDWAGSDFILSENADEWESQYIIDEPQGVEVHSPMDYETALNYCSGAPDGVLMFCPIGDDEYQVYRTYED